MIFLNKKICDIAESIENFKEDSYIPVRINFHIQKNLGIIKNAYQDIQSVREKILLNYGTVENDQIIVPPDKIKETNKELEDLANIEQDLNIKMLPLKEFDNIDLTTSQLNGILFMIYDDSEKGDN